MVTPVVYEMSSVIKGSTISVEVEWKEMSKKGKKCLKNHLVKKKNKW